jgi:hypothetical protein
VRLYRPRDAILNGTWKFPEAQPLGRVLERCSEHLAPVRQGAELKPASDQKRTSVELRTRPWQISRPISLVCSKSGSRHLSTTPCSMRIGPVLIADSRHQCDQPLVAWDDTEDLWRAASR